MPDKDDILQDADLGCYLSFRKERPELNILFNPRSLTHAQIHELSDVLERTAQKWLNCRVCSGGENCHDRIGSGAGSVAVDDRTHGGRNNLH